MKNMTMMKLIKNASNAAKSVKKYSTAMKKPLLNAMAYSIA